MRVCFLIENDQIQSKLAHSIPLSRSNAPPPQGSCIRFRFLLSLLIALPLSTQVHCAWVKGDAGFQDSQVSDLFSKWAARVLLWHRNLTPPLPLRSITLHKRQILRVTSAAKIKACLPKHEFADLHLAFSSYFYKHCSFYSAFTFKSASGNFCMATYEPLWCLAEYLCPVGSENHPLDPITFTSECPPMCPLRQRMFQEWPPPFDVLTAVWWETQDVTNTLADMLPPGWKVLGRTEGGPTSRPREATTSPHQHPPGNPGSPP